MKTSLFANIVILRRGASYLLIASFGALLAFYLPETSTAISKGRLTFNERVVYQRVIEDVYWRHRSWPKENPNPKPSLDAVVSQAQLEKKVTDYLRKSQVLEDYWQQPITAEQLQAEMDRMAKYTKKPEVLHELFESLGNDPFVIAECLARPLLAERLFQSKLRGSSKTDEETVQSHGRQNADVTTLVSYSLPIIGATSDPDGGCMDDNWTATSLINVPSGRWYHTAVWTGTEMIVWGGFDGNAHDTGGRYDPITDSWTATTMVNVPTARETHTAVWTGTEMIVWGGYDQYFFELDTGGRYDPISDSWTATSIANVPTARVGHSAIWTGTEMIVWGGGYCCTSELSTGGRYNPTTDSWTATSIVNAPSPRESHTAVWTGDEMIVWAGGGFINNTGGRYNPSTDSWKATSTVNAPTARFAQTAVWTGGEMIVWGGLGNGGFFNTGGRYNPDTDNWISTNTTNAPEVRGFHTAVWTGGEMIVWGGEDGYWLNTGGRYDPGTDSWTATSITDAPSEREDHTAVWTGSEMIVWGGRPFLNTGGRYCAQTSLPSPTPTPSEPPCEVTGSYPECNNTLSTEVTDFVVYVSYFIFEGVSASAFTVNGIPADSAQAGGSIIIFHFNASPLVRGQNSMHLTAGAFTCINGRSGGEFMCTFTYQPSTPTPTPTSTATATTTPTPRPFSTPRPRPTPAPRP